MKVMLSPKKNNCSVYAMRLHYNANSYVMNNDFNSSMIKGYSNPLAFDLEYDLDNANYLPIDTILCGNNEFKCKEEGVCVIRRKEFLELFKNSVNAHRVYSGIDRNQYRDFYTIKDGVVYSLTEDICIPMMGLFIKNNTTNRISLKKDKVLNEAIGSPVFSIPVDSILYINPVCLEKGTSEEKIFGTTCRKMLKTYAFIKSTGDMSIFNDLFKHKIKEPRGFSEFEQFNSTVNTHLKEVLDEIYE
jgi:hypothetical protein